MIEEISFAKFQCIYVKNNLNVVQTKYDSLYFQVMKKTSLFTRHMAKIYINIVIKTEIKIYFLLV